VERGVKHNIIYYIIHKFWLVDDHFVLIHTHTHTLTQTNAQVSMEME
jgi:hypothetical protein